jgi:hypothetical protein
MISSGADENVSTILQHSARSELAAYGVNSWQVALAKAILNDAWFCAEGYAQVL